MATGLFNRPATEAKQPLECGQRAFVAPDRASVWCPICIEQVPVQKS